MLSYLLYDCYLFVSFKEIEVIELAEFPYHSAFPH